mmetsp:Transcript_21951/g.65678  ORF Transcript_21951/g.65678 Transcript_21951/m.65678 type:complete len:125 (+) Transcript_21951:2925-3299(+)
MRVAVPSRAGGQTTRPKSAAAFANCQIDVPHAATPHRYHGLARAFVRSTTDQATAPAHRQRLLEIDLDSNVVVASPDERLVDPAPIVVEVTVDGGLTAQVSIPVTASLDELPMAVAMREGLKRQ